ncbi:MAG: nitroreductase family protein [Sporomusaceae bacterium]|nr:nitroreductase family protein [Sporomusaceae bacterium]
MIDIPDLYSMIFQRKSIRKYELEPLTAEAMAGISAFAASLRPLDASFRTEMRLLPPAAVKHNLLRIKAPHYLAAYSETGPLYLTNIGFMLQQLDLFLAARGIGSCWQGIPRPVSEVRAASELAFVILLSFGRAREPLYRNSRQEFKRKPLSQVTDVDGLDDLLEAVRLAPSATNSQPWFFSGDRRRLHAYCVKTNFLKALLYEQMNQIDMGIALCHLWLAAQTAGRTVAFVQDDAASANPPDGYYYICSADLL